MCLSLGDLSGEAAQVGNYLPKFTTCQRCTPAMTSRVPWQADRQSVSECRARLPKAAQGRLFRRPVLRHAATDCLGTPDFILSTHLYLHPASKCYIRNPRVL